MSLKIRSEKIFNFDKGDIIKIDEIYEIKDLPIWKWWEFNSDKNLIERRMGNKSVYVTITRNVKIKIIDYEI